LETGFLRYTEQGKEKTHRIDRYIPLEWFNINPKPMETIRKQLESTKTTGQITQSTKSTKDIASTAKSQKNTRTAEHKLNSHAKTAEPRRRVVIPRKNAANRLSYRPEPTENHDAKDTGNRPLEKHFTQKQNFQKFSPDVPINSVALKHSRISNFDFLQKVECLDTEVAVADLVASEVDMAKEEGGRCGRARTVGASPAASNAALTTTVPF
jgi:hypothetical protein